MDESKLYRRNIKAAYEASGKSVYRIIQETGLSRHTVENAVAGRSNMRLPTFVALCRALEVSPGDMFSENYADKKELPGD